MTIPTKNQDVIADDMIHKLILTALIKNWNDDKINDELLPALSLCLDSGSDINYCDHTEMTPLMYATAFDKQGLVEFLMANGADLSIQNKDSNTALMMAVLADNVDMVRLLAHSHEALDIQNNVGSTALMMAASYGKGEMIKHIWDAGASYLIRDNHGMMAGDLAYNNGHREIWETIIREQETNEIIINIIARDSNQAIELIDGGYDINLANDDGFTPLICAIQHGDVKVIEALVGHGVNIDAQSDNGRTALMECSIFYNKKIAICLLDNCANLDIQDHQGETALISSIIDQNEALAELLIDRGANLELTDVKGKTALYYASLHASETLFDKLLDHGATFDDLFHTSHNIYETVLQYYYDLGQDYIADRLIKHGLEEDRLHLLSLNSPYHHKIRESLQHHGPFNTEEDLNRFMRLSRDKSILQLTYSQENLPITQPAIHTLTQSLLSEADDFPNKELFHQALDIITDSSKSIILPNNYSLRTSLIGYQDHSAYFIVESDDKNNPMTLTCCDGSNLFNGYGCTTFIIDQEKINSIAQQDQDWLQLLRDDMHVPYYDDPARLFKVLKKVIQCNEQGRLIASQSTIFTKESIRGNCAIKSINLALRELLQRSDPEMVFEEDGKAGGYGYDIYKNHYKDILIKQPISRVIHCIEDSNSDDYSHKNAINFLEKVIYPKAVSKNHEQRVKELEAILVKNKVDNMVSITEISASNLYQKERNSDNGVIK